MKEENNITLSRYNHSLVLEDTEFIYNLVNGCFVKAQKLQSYDSRFYVESDLDEYDNLLLKVNAQRNDNSFLCINILLTKQCNFSCPYCYQKNENINIDESLIPHLSNFIARYKKRNKNFTNLIVIWFGGEPLLNMHSLLTFNTMLLRTSENLLLNYTSKIITNGYYLNKLSSQIINDLHLTEIQVTLDGMHTVHNLRRNTSDGLGTFDIIMNNVKSINYPIDITIRMNIDKKILMMHYYCIMN